MSRNKKSSRVVRFKPYAKLVMIQYQPSRGAPRVHLFPRGANMEVSEDGTKLLIHCKVKHGDIQD